MCVGEDCSAALLEWSLVSITLQRIGDSHLYPFTPQMSWHLQAPLMEEVQGYVQHPSIMNSELV